MRVSKEKAAENRHDILIAAARLFREQGVSATGVDSITKAVSLTHGAVYSHFGSCGSRPASIPGWQISLTCWSTPGFFQLRTDYA